jgi:glycosyltransferase involved in cell wall biosynthesis
LLAQLALIQLERFCGLHRRAYWAQHTVSAWRQSLAGIGANLVVVNDTLALPLAFEVADGAPVIFDAHEYSPDEYASWTWRVFARRHIAWISRIYIPQTAGMMVVGPQIGKLYERDTGTQPVVVTNAPPYAELRPTKVEGPIRMLHLGLADPQRRIEDTIEVMRHLGDQYALDLLLAGSGRFPSYVEKLRRLASDDERIRFLDPVPMREIPRFANAYDIGVFLLPPQHVNQRFTLPNKLFEYIQGRIVSAIGPSPEMARIVREWDCGIVAADFDPKSLADAIASTSRERLELMKRNASNAARELCAERNQEIILSLVDAALGSGQPSGRRASVDGAPARAS